MREKATALVARIAADMPGYTVHDITHLDALWETASLVAPQELALTPPEAFVFGGAVLLHDAAMTLAAYPGGLAELKRTTVWADVAALHAARSSSASTPPPEEGEAPIKTEVLRRLHAEKAAELATHGWRVSECDDQRVYLIDHQDLRRFYGPSIGSVAHSHWWPIAQVERELTRILGAMPPHTRNEVDLLKLAALLRVSDSLHLDRRRAPQFTRALEQPQGFSALHWIAQERLAFPRIEADAVVFTSGEAFEPKDAEAWWLAYDAFVVADQELRDADLLLRNWGRIPLLARRVQGVGHPRDMAHYVPVSGWRPVETRVRVSDVRKIVETLGGEKLYGDEPTATVRELLQNAMDAIQARRHLQGRAPDWGIVSVQLTERGENIWLSVEDTGIGMSEAVLSGPLVDFGASLWRSPQINDEHPGLAARWTDAIGRFGIGFFSVFILGDEIRVITRRYDRSEDDALVLEFRSGLNGRPMLRPAVPGSAPVDGGTRVEIKLWNNPRRKNGIQLCSRHTGDEAAEHRRWRNLVFEGGLPLSFPSLADLVASLAPASHISIDTVEFGRRKRAVSANDWLTISPARLAGRVSLTSQKKDHVRKAVEACMRPIVTVDKQVVGRAALYPSMASFQLPGALVVGGLRVMGIRHMLGVVSGEVVNAARDKGRVLFPPEKLSDWATQQAKLIQRSDLDAERKSLCAEFSLRSGGFIFGLPVAKWAGVWLNSDELRWRFANVDEVPMYLGNVSHTEVDSVPEFVFEQEFEPSDDVLFVVELDQEPGRISHLRRLILAILEKEWGKYDVEDFDDHVVGIAGDEEILRPVELFRRRMAA